MVIRIVTSPVADVVVAGTGTSEDVVDALKLVETGSGVKSGMPDDVPVVTRVELVDAPDVMVVAVGERSAVLVVVEDAGGTMVVVPRVVVEVTLDTLVVLVHVVVDQRGASSAAMAGCCHSYSTTAARRAR